jgi:hypothetical protein
MMKKRILYGNANYEEIVNDNGYFVDKTQYIELLETIKNPVFLRPRRFGKSLWCRILECYYNIRQKDDFDRLFGDTYIGKNPTPLRNSFFVLPLDFSVVDPTGNISEIEQSFDLNFNSRLKAVLGRLQSWFKGGIEVEMDKNASSNLKRLLDFVWEKDLPKLYIIIDEYDNFANQLIVARDDKLYRELTADDGFLKTFFKTLKEGRKTGAIANVFITGVLPITMDELASGFNIARFITLHPQFENMLGFTQKEVDTLLDSIYSDYEFDSSTRHEVDAIIKNHYNGYHFVNPKGEAVYNSTILTNFLVEFCENREIPKHLTDLNLRTDFSWIRRLTGSNPHTTEEFVNQLTTENIIRYDDRFLVTKFDMHQFFDKDFFPVSFFYLGMLTRHDDFYLKLPNLNMRQIFVEYFNELHRIDVSTKYAEMMQGFIDTLNIHQLFEDYWNLYVSQLPEAIFQKMNENFYRTTFFELCSRYLSSWFTFNVERSYPQGRSDLEFVGKYHERFAGVRIVIEFKYFSNSELKKMKTTVKKFSLREEDTIQISGYVEGLKNEYSGEQYANNTSQYKHCNLKISQYVIYCFGNKGFRVFEV